MDVHAPHESLHTWKDFWIHLGTITIGLLLAIGLEQSVEWMHHRHQRHQLQEDLRAEAEQNRAVIARDLRMRELEPWFDLAMRGAARGAGQSGNVQVNLPLPPCIPGSVGTAEVRYFAPSQAVWATAKESGLVALLPVEEGRMYARLGHNYDLLGQARDKVANGCDEVAAMRKRFARPQPGGAQELWTMTAEQAEALGKTSAQTEIDMQGLLFRLRWSDVYEEAIVRGENKADLKMMTINQERFEDSGSGSQ
jgi:hypothetical protein